MYVIAIKTREVRGKRNHDFSDIENHRGRKKPGIHPDHSISICMAYRYIKCALAMSSDRSGSRADADGSRPSHE